jgi:flagellar biosynthesis protein FlhB
MANDQGGEKTEEPTSKRMREIFADGDFAKVPEVAAAAVMLMGFVLFRWQGSGVMHGFFEFCRDWFALLNVSLLSDAGIVAGTRRLIVEVMLVLTVFFAAVAFAAFVANAAQTSLKLSPKALTWKFSKIDPLKGVNKLVGKQKWVQLTIEVTKFVTIGVVLGVLIWNLRSDPIFAQLMPLGYLMGFIVKVTTDLTMGLVLTLLVIALVHYFWNRHIKKSDWKMTKQEVRDEHRQSEGDPNVKRARRQAAMQLRQRRMLQQIPLADVVVTNPTHYAIVLKYDPAFEDAPRVIAKGARSRALFLKKLAAEHGIPMIENKPVARGLYRRVAVGQLIPAEFFPAVAGILSFVYRHYKYHVSEVKRRRAAAPLDL